MAAMDSCQQGDLERSSRETAAKRVNRASAFARHEGVCGTDRVAVSRAITHRAHARPQAQPPPSTTGDHHLAERRVPCRFALVLGLLLCGWCLWTVPGALCGEPNRATPTLTQPGDSTIPVLTNSNGQLTHEAYTFTTQAYNREALRLVLGEANRVAKALQLPEDLPITEASLTRRFIVGYGMSLGLPRGIGNVHTRDYGYFVSVDHKLSFVEGAHQDEDCLKWIKEYKWPRSRIDTNTAYRLATQWLAAASMDVSGLNRDCRVHLGLDSFANPPKAKTATFVPIYSVYWQSAKNRKEGYGCVASVKLFVPTKALVSLRVEESKYILSSPLVFTNLESLLKAPREE